MPATPLVCLVDDELRSNHLRVADIDEAHLNWMVAHLLLFLFVEWTELVRQGSALASPIPTLTLILFAHLIVVAVAAVVLFRLFWVARSVLSDESFTLGGNHSSLMISCHASPLRAFPHTPGARAIRWRFIGTRQFRCGKEPQQEAKRPSLDCPHRPPPRDHDSDHDNDCDCDCDCDTDCDADRDSDRDSDSDCDRDRDHARDHARDRENDRLRTGVIWLTPRRRRSATRCGLRRFSNQS